MRPSLVAELATSLTGAGRAQLKASRHTTRQHLVQHRAQRTLTTTSTRHEQNATPPARPPFQARTSTPTSPPAASAFQSPTPPQSTATTTRTEALQRDAASPANDDTVSRRSLTDVLGDPPPVLDEGETQVDWTRSFHGLSSSPFSAEQSAVLTAELSADDIEIKPDGIVYLPEIKYRRILNKAFGPGGWGLAPRGETIVTGKVVTREYGLVCAGRWVPNI